MKLFQFHLPLEDGSFCFSAYLDPFILGFLMYIRLDVSRHTFSTCGAAILDRELFEMRQRKLSLYTGALGTRQHICIRFISNLLKQPLCLHVQSIRVVIALRSF